MSRAGLLPVLPPGAHVVARLPAGRTFRLEPVEGGGAVLLVEAPTRDDGRAAKEIRRQITRRMGGSDGRR